MQSLVRQYDCLIRRLSHWRDNQLARRALRQAGFEGKVWLDSPPQNRQESPVLAGLRYLAFDVPPFRWFFEREVFAVAANLARDKGLL